MYISCCSSRNMTSPHLRRRRRETIRRDLSAPPHLVHPYISMCALLLKFTQRAEGNRWAHTHAKVEAGGVLNDSDDYYDLPRGPLWSGGQLPFWLHGELRGPSFA